MTPVVRQTPGKEGESLQPAEPAEGGHSEPAHPSGSSELASEYRPSVCLECPQVHQGILLDCVGSRRKPSGRWLLSPRPPLGKLDLPGGGTVPVGTGRRLPCCQGAKGSKYTVIQPERQPVPTFRFSITSCGIYS